MIDLENYTFSYDDIEVLRDFSLHVDKSEKIALLGSNGSGKSTLLRILAGLYFGKGSYRFKDKIINKKSIDKSFRKSVGIMFQNPESMIFNPTVYDEIAFSLREFDMEDVEERVFKIAKDFDIVDLLRKNPLSLSGGEKQKVVLASILVYEPEVLLLDEPTASMDPYTSGWFSDFLLELDGCVLLATHDLSLAYETSTKAVVLDNKHKKIYDGDLERLYSDLDLLVSANLIHKHTHKHRKFQHSHYHLH